MTKNPTTCSTDGCTAEAVGRGWCKPHYNAWYRHGDPLSTGTKKKGRPPVDPALRIWSKIDRSDPDGCWPWVGSMRHAYGEIYVDGQRRYAHRTVFEVVRGPIPEGQMVLHRCDNPRCCRPDHLFLGVHVDNMRDMAEKGQWGNQVRVQGERVEHVLNADRTCLHCGRPVLARNLCRAHYQADRKVRLSTSTSG